MKRYLLTLSVICLFTALASATTLSVQVKKGVLKASPSFLAKNLATLGYGERVTKLTQQGEWINISTGKQRGWVHASALTDRKVVLQTGATRAETGVSSSEVMLAGKGFNAEVESKYRTHNPAMRFDLVDKMEAFTIPPKNEQRFAERGQLRK